MTDPATTPAADIARVARSARDAFKSQFETPAFDSATVLDAVAAAIDAHSQDLWMLAAEETGLSETRLRGEIVRTVGQMQSFADAVRAGEALEAIIDPADPTALVPRPDQRRANVALGPVAVFAASNFPFAFGVAGGDTASAWAAGCPVVVKAHPGHPRTSRAVAAAVAKGLAAAGAPSAWFSLVEGAGEATGLALVEAPPIQAVAFTGSRRGGTALAQVGAMRPRPIPVYAEMGSSNPVFVTSAAAEARGAEIAARLARAITDHAGQLCTKPGVLFLVDEPATRTLVTALASAIEEVPAQLMLYPGLAEGFESGLEAALADSRIAALAAGGADEGGSLQPATLLEMQGRELKFDDPRLEEMFGPAALIVWVDNEEGLLEAAERHVAGSLTASIQAIAGEPIAAHLLRVLSARVGRLIWNGLPTGVTVGHATVHGGPFPATTAPQTTSVGIAAMRRFLRPVAYQDVPDEFLPPALQDANPLGLMRQVDGGWTRDAIVRSQGT